MRRRGKSRKAKTVTVRGERREVTVAPERCAASGSGRASPEGSCPALHRRWRARTDEGCGGEERAERQSGSLRPFYPHPALRATFPQGNANAGGGGSAGRGCGPCGAAARGDSGKAERFAASVLPSSVRLRRPPSPKGRLLRAPGAAQAEAAVHAAQRRGKSRKAKTVAVRGERREVTVAPERCAASGSGRASPEGSCPALHRRWRARTDEGCGGEERAERQSGSLRPFYPHPALRATFPQGKANAGGGGSARRGCGPCGAATRGDSGKAERFAASVLPSSGAARHLPPREG